MVFWHFFKKTIVFVLWARVFEDFGKKIFGMIVTTEIDVSRGTLEEKSFFLKEIQFLQTVFDFQQKLTECGEKISAGLSKLK